MTLVPKETIRAPTAIPMIANFTGVKFRLELSAVRNKATINELAIAPRNTPYTGIDIRPTVTAAINITAPPPIPKRLGSPIGLLVDSWIKTPDRPKEAPTRTLNITRGILIDHTTVVITPSSDLISPL
jgi:hypothetical protein